MSEGQAAAEILRARGIAGPVEIAVVLGTGLGAIADGLAEPIEVPYADLPGFPAAGVSGHAGRLVVGGWEGTRVAVMQGRAHYYETGDAGAMREPIAALRALGVATLILTNSAGSLHADWYPGSMVLIADHINLSGTNPLIGVPGDDRFVPLGDAYDRFLRTRLRAAAAQGGVSTVREGVYMWLSGPSFETPAEIKMAKLLGADLVGMSTVPEVIIARRLGMKVAAVSVVTNFATGIGNAKPPSHAETKDVARTTSIALKRLLRAYFRSLRDDA